MERPDFFKVKGGVGIFLILVIKCPAGFPDAEFITIFVDLE